MTHPGIEALAESIGFDLPMQYNASRLLWNNLEENAGRPAVLHDSGTWTYAELAKEAARIGNYLQGPCEPGDRVLLFMDDEPAYPAAIMGAMRAGMVPILSVLRGNCSSRRKPTVTSGQAWMSKGKRIATLRICSFSEGGRRDNT